jgi:hypothetical protein
MIAVDGAFVKFGHDQSSFPRRTDGRASSAIPETAIRDAPSVFACQTDTPLSHFALLYPALLDISTTIMRGLGVYPTSGEKSPQLGVRLIGRRALRDHRRMRRRIVGLVLIAAAAALLAGCVERQVDVMQTPVPPPPAQQALPNQ